MNSQFEKSVTLGRQLSTRLYYGKDPLLPPDSYSSSSASHSLKSMKRHESQHLENYLPTSVTVYAAITNPAIVENPDVRSYQPYVHGRCYPPALIPLHLYEVGVQVESCLDAAFVEFTGVWRLHCVDFGRTCDCLLAIPIAHQMMIDDGNKHHNYVLHTCFYDHGPKSYYVGTILYKIMVGMLLCLVTLQGGFSSRFEVEASRGSYTSQLVKVEDTSELDGLTKAENGGFLNSNIFTLKIPKVEGGSKLSVKARWSQKLTYREDQLCLSLPFSFPSYVTPVGKFSGKEKIVLIVNSLAQTKALSYSTTHQLKELKREDDKFCFSYESEVDTWSKTDFEFSYKVSSSDIRGGVLVQTPPSDDLEQREMFTFYLFPGSTENYKIFRKKVVFLVDISGSMAGPPLENVKQAVLGSLSKFNEDDYFNIIAFNRETYMFSSSMELATQDALERASEWFSYKLIAQGDTDIMLPMKQALEMVSHESNSISLIFLLTDGAVENEKDICNVVKDTRRSKPGLPFPRISTFGIGSYCNHYFLRMLAQIGRGRYDAAYDADSIALRLQRFLTVSSSIILSNIEVDCFDHIESLKLYPAAVKDLSYECPVIMSGRYKGKLPESFEVRATLADMTCFTTTVKIQEAKDIPLHKVYAQEEIDALTAEAWYTESKEVEKQVTEISMQTRFPSEYTRMIMVRTQSDDQGPGFITIQGKEAYDTTNLQNMVRHKKLIPLQSLGVGFGDLKRTAENLPPGVAVKTADATDIIVKAASGCCHQFLDRFCCMCCIQVITKMSDRLVITLTQLCAALSCCECLACCYDLCDNCF